MKMIVTTFFGTNQGIVEQNENKQINRAKHAKLAKASPPPFLSNSILASLAFSARDISFARQKFKYFWLAFLITAVSSGPAIAWTTANRYGGSTTHTYGSTTHTNAYGGSTSHAYGEGTEHTNMYGGSTAHGWYGGTTHTNVYGGTTSGAYGAGVYHTYPSGASYYHPPYPAYHPAYPVYPYHPPVAVPYYSAAGCYGCAAAAGAVVGMATGAAIASAGTAAATSSAYAAGVAAGSAAPVVTAPATYVMGVNYAVLPTGCATPNIGGTTYFLCGNTWFQPFYGANGVYYRVVPTP